MTEQYMVVASQTCVYLWSVDGLGESGIFSSRVCEEERKEHDSFESSASMRCAMDRARQGPDPRSEFTISWQHHNQMPFVDPTLRSYDDHICALAVSEQVLLLYDGTLIILVQVNVLPQWIRSMYLSGCNLG